ncbi:MAG: TonB-dependent receptor [Bacteroidales bacterium]|nr:TonB-dependent receptor [Bacteroidales bacterium]
MKTKLLQLLMAFVALPVLVFAQGTGTIQGKVMDSQTKETLIGATVRVKGTSTGTITDINGAYTLKISEPGSYTLLVSYVGYSNAEKQVTLSAGQQANVDFDLSADLIGLDQIVVTGVVNQKSALESSINVSTMRPKAVEEFGAVTTAEIFKAIPGIHSEATGGEGNANISVRGIPITSGGSKFLQLHEDGLPVMQFGDISFGNADIYLRSDYTTDRIEAIKGGSASTFASNSPAGIINFISKTGAVEGGSIGTSLGVDYKSFRTDFEYGSPIGNDVSFHVGGFFRQGEGPRKAGYEGNYGGQIKANLTKNFKKGYARVYFKYLNDRAISYMPMPVKGTGTAADPTFESVEGYDALTATLQSPYFLKLNGVDGNGNLRTSDISDGMHPVSTAFGTEFSFDLGDGWNVKNKARMAFNKGKFNSPFPVAINTADAIATSIAGEGYTASYANGANAGVTLTAAELSSLNGNGLLMTVHSFDVEMNSLDNFTNDFYLTKTFNDKIHLTAGYYKAYQRIDMTWLWQAYVTDITTDGSRLINLTRANGVAATENGLYAHGVPAWGNCCTRGYDMRYSVDAPYANVGVDITSDLNIDASLRYDFGNAYGSYLTNMQTPVDVNNDGVMSAIDSTTTVLNNANPKSVAYDYSYLSYSVGANYKLDNDKAVFARISKGARANADRLLYSAYITDEGKTIEGLDADEIFQAELGFKYKSSNVAFNATTFYAKLSEQNSEFDKVFNIEYTSFGMEVDGSVKFGNFETTAGATYTKAEISKSNNPDQEGNTPRRVPDLMFNINPSYRIGKAAVGFSLVGTTKVFAQFDNVVVLPGFTYVNAFASYKLTKGLVIRANVNNLFNTFGLTEMEGDAFTDNAVNYMRGRPITGRATSFSVIYNF